MSDEEGSKETVSLYAAIGGEATVRALVDRFYALMDTLPEAKACRDIHPKSLEGSAQKLTWYLTGWLGGPQLYVERFGHPMLRRRHFVAPIGPAERDGWLLCFERALAETIPEPTLREAIRAPARQLAMHMQNKE
ncbi:MAG: group II truncated hemoglobin [Hyphomicrobiaceae bacterium]|nr:group II truncated hemoglobin [Hyphomicrobiaceae bacterium]